MNRSDLLNNLDLFASKVFFAISVLSIFFVQLYLTGRVKYFSITLLVGICITLLVYTCLRKNVLPIISQVNIKYKYLNLKTILIIYLLLYSQSILLLFSSVYNRSLLYFIIIALICTLIVIQIEMYSRSKYSIALILFEICLLSLNLRWGILYEFPDLVGVDPVYHLNLAMNIVNSGSIPLGLDYSPYPLMHILIAITNLIVYVSPKNSMIFSIGFMVAVLLPLFIYVVCTRIFTVQLALISALLVAISNYLIWYGYILFGTTMGFIYFIIFLYFIINTKSIQYRLLSIIFFIVTVLTHPLTTVVLLFSIIILFLVELYYTVHVDNASVNEIPRMNTGLIILFISFTIAYWMYSTTFFSSSSFFNFIIETLLAKMNATEAVPSTLSMSLERVNFLNEAINALGAVLVMCLAVVGALHTIRIKGNNPLAIYVVSIGFIIFLTAGLFQVIGFENILPERWFGFAYLLLAIPASAGFQLLYNTGAKKTLVLCIQSMLIFIVAFLMITSSVANMDSPIYSKDISLRIGFFESELVAKDFYVFHSNAPFITDMRYEPMRAFDDRGIKFVGTLTIDDISPEDIIIIRDYVLNNRFDIPARNPNGAAPVMFDQQFKRNLELEGVNEIYTNNIVKMYLIN